MLNIDNLDEDQREAVNRLYMHDATLLSAPMGFGKTVVSQTAIEMLLEDKVVSRVLIIAPIKVIRETWATEHEAWEQLSPVECAIGTPAERARAIESGAPIIAINPENLRWLFDRYPDLNCDGLLIDEITKLKSVGGVGFKALRARLKRFVWRCGMTGTIASEDLQEIYAPMLLVDSSVLGTSKAGFLAKYFYAFKRGERVVYEAHPDAAVRIAHAIRHTIYRVDDHYEAGLPPIERKVLGVRLPFAAQGVYDAMKKDMLLEIGGATVAAANLGVMTNKLTQIANGFIYGEDETFALHEGKLNAIDDSAPCLLVYEYKAELEAIKARFPHAVDVKEKGAVEKWNAGEIDMLLLHPKSAGHGLNLQHHPRCNRVVFVRPPWSSDMFKQVIARIRRRGTAQKVINVEVICAINTVDDKVALPRLDSKAKAAGLFMAHLRD